MYVVRTYVRTRLLFSKLVVTQRKNTSKVRTYGNSATVELRVLNPQDGADQRRGDIKVSKHGNTWILDVGVVCPSRPSATSTRAVTPHLAAKAYAAVKAAKYCDQDNFITFMPEIGGRVNKAARDWLDRLPTQANRYPVRMTIWGTHRCGRPRRPSLGRLCSAGACRPTCVRGLWWRSAAVRSADLDVELEL
jgi:hypothetical protein